MTRTKPESGLAYSRRCLLRRTGAGLLASGVSTTGLSASPPEDMSWAHTGTAPELRDTRVRLEIAEQRVNFTGRVRVATTINGSLPAPTLRFREGDTVTIEVHNRLPETTSIHWHGILLPWQMDGVPGISFPGIAPGATFTYRFQLRQSGTYWYHAHSGMQELTGMYGALIVEPREPRGPGHDREHVLLFSDWMDADPVRVLTRLRIQSDYYNLHRPTAQDFFRDLSETGFGAALERRRMWLQMRMKPTDLADLSAEALTYLANGTPTERNWCGLFQPGERLRLRCINGSGNTFFDVRIPGLKLTVVQADGQDVEPVTVDEFRFGPGQTYDLLVRPEADVHAIFAQSMDRSGSVRATLAVREDLVAEVPDLDPVVWLSMTDMMGNMQHAGHAMGDGQQAGQTASGGQHAGHHGGASMDHSMHAAPPKHAARPERDAPLARASQVVRHASTEFGPGVDMRVEQPRTNLDDPGVGLRDNGRRVLTLADLVTVGGPLDARGAEREIELHLTGNMERYSWAFDGLEFGRSTPVHFRHGERLRVILQNDTMMTHPMHLHGLWAELENDQGSFLSRLHTIPVQPAQRLSFLVTADALGRWAWHCHLMFHMDSGMFREVVVA